MDTDIVKFIPYIIKYCESQFPKKCTVCKKSYDSFSQFIKETKPIGVMVNVPGDMEACLQTLSMANCHCGTTLGIVCLDKEKEMFQELTDFVKNKAIKSNIDVVDVMNKIRDEVRKCAVH